MTHKVRHAYRPAYLPLGGQAGLTSEPGTWNPELTIDNLQNPEPGARRPSQAAAYTRKTKPSTCAVPWEEHRAKHVRASTLPTNMLKKQLYRVRLNRKPFGSQPLRQQTLGRTGQNLAESGTAGQNWAESGTAGQNWAGLGRIGQNWAELGRVGQNWADLDRLAALACQSVVPARAAGRSRKMKFFQEHLTGRHVIYDTTNDDERRQETIPESFSGLCGSRHTRAAGAARCHCTLGRCASFARGGRHVGKVRRRRATSPLQAISIYR